MRTDAYFGNTALPTRSGRNGADGCSYRLIVPGLTASHAKDGVERSLKRARRLRCYVLFSSLLFNSSKHPRFLTSLSLCGWHQDDHTHFYSRTPSILYHSANIFFSTPLHPSRNNIFISQKLPRSKSFSTRAKPYSSRTLPTTPPSHLRPYLPTPTPSPSLSF